MTTPTVVSWAAWSGKLNLAGTWLAFLGNPVTPWIMSVLAFGELIADKHPATPSRKLLLGFTARSCSGLVAGSAIGSQADAPVLGAVLGMIGAMGGTYLCAEARRRLAEKIGKDWPAAVIEDLVAIASAVLVVALVP